MVLKPSSRSIALTDSMIVLLEVPAIAVAPANSPHIIARLQRRWNSMTIATFLKVQSPVNEIHSQS